MKNLKLMAYSTVDSVELTNNILFIDQPFTHYELSIIRTTFAVPIIQRKEFLVHHLDFKRVNKVGLYYQQL